MTVKELIETLKTCDEKSEVKVEHWNSTISPIEEVIDYSKELSEVIIIIDVIRKAGSNKAGFIKFDD
nr:MAG: hypothetical protein [Bacteriophage sp.]